MSDNKSVQPAEKLTKKQLKADQPTWCPACGDFAVLASFFTVIQKLGLTQSDFVCVAGIGCSSRIPYFVNSHGIHFIHGRALPLATGISLSRPDQHVFVFGGDGDGFSIGGNHLNHAARKNINLTYIIMDNFVYGLTKNQTSPTTPVGRRSKTDPNGSVDRPINPMMQLISSGATFIGRSHATHVKHMNEMFERAIQHKGFALVDIFSPCVTFNLDNGHSFFKERVTKLEDEGHDTSDWQSACEKAIAWGDTIYTGLFYRNDEKPDLGQREQVLEKEGPLAHRPLGLSKEQVEGIISRMI